MVYTILSPSPVIYDITGDVLSSKRLSILHARGASVLEKGLFWVIDDNDERFMLIYAAACDENGERFCALPVYNSKNGNSFSHERSWRETAKEQPNKINSKPWNYFPRGRVEIKNGEAKVYFNPSLIEWKDFEISVMRHFELESIQTEFLPDFSNHYKSTERGA